MYTNKEGCKNEGKFRIAENCRGRKLSQILWFCGYTQKFSPQNLGHGVLWHGKSKQSAKVFSAKNAFSPIRKSFLPRKFLPIRYTKSHPSLHLFHNTVEAQLFGPTRFKPIPGKQKLIININSIAIHCTDSLAGGLVFLFIAIR